MIEWVETNKYKYESQIGTVLRERSRANVFENRSGRLLKGWIAQHAISSSSYRVLRGTFETLELAKQAVIDAEIQELTRRAELVDMVVIPAAHKQWLNLPVVISGECSQRCPYFIEIDRMYCSYFDKELPEKKPHPDCIAACKTKEVIK